MKYSFSEFKRSAAVIAEDNIKVTLEGVFLKAESMQCVSPHQAQTVWYCE